MISKNSITSAQLSSLLIGSMIGIGILSLPREVTKESYQDGWISVFLGGIYPILVIWLINILMKKFKEKTIIDINKIILGKFIGNIVNIFILIQLLTLLILVARILAELIQNYVLTNMPLGINLLIILCTIIYPSTLGLKAIGRTSQFIQCFLMPAMVLLVYILKDGEFINIMPIGDSGILKILEGIKTTAMAYLGFDVLLIFYPYVTNKDKILYKNFMGVFITILIYTLVVFISIVYMGVDLPQKQVWPLSIAPASIEIPVVETIQPFFFMFWIMVIFNNLSIRYFAIFQSLNILFKVKTYKIILHLVLVSIIYYVSFKFIKNIPQREEMFSPLLSTFLVFDMLLPIILLAVYFFFGKSDKFDS